MKTYIVSGKDAGQRLDRYMAALERLRRALDDRDAAALQDFFTLAGERKRRLIHG